MTHLSMAQALSLWSELEQALHGTNGYGSDTAEIYIYRLMRRCPTLEAGIDSQVAAEEYAQANASLYDLLAHFAVERDATITVEGRRLGKWLRRARHDHRVHVKVVASARKARGAR